MLRRTYLCTITLLLSPITLSGSLIEAKYSDFIEIVLKAERKTAEVNGEQVSLEFAAQTRGIITYVPLRFIGTQLGATMQWIQNENQFSIKLTM